MTALLFSLTLFLYWTVVGLAVIAIFPPRLRILQGILISPAVGIATVILPVFYLSRAGLPVKDFAGWLLPALGSLALVVLFVRKPILPWKHLRWFALILLGAWLLSGWPMLNYGFDWVSFANSDMANYSLGAQRFLNHGYFDLPDINEILSGRDYSQVYWFMHAAGGIRAGSELMLAAVWGLIGLNAHQIFMPVIMALHLSLICGGAALAAGPIRSAKAPLIAAGLIAISPLTTLGTLYQLIAQVGGLALLCAAVVLFYRKISLRPVTRFLRANVVGAVVFGVLFVWYPEVLPFLGLGWFVYLALKLRREGNATLRVVMRALVIGGEGKAALRVVVPTLVIEGEGKAARKAALRVVVPALVIGGFALALLGGFILSSLQFMLDQAARGTTSAEPGNILFPYFLVPSGMPVLLGLIPMAGGVQEPVLSVSIAVAIVLIIWIVKLLISHTKESSPAALGLVVMIVTWLLLFFTNNAFGLFKLSMYLQPFLLAMVGVGLARWKGKPIRSKALLAAGILVANVVSQLGYVNKSTGEVHAGMQSVPGASSERINSDFSMLMGNLKRNSRSLVSDAENIVLATFQALYMYDRGGYFLSRDVFTGIVDLGKGAAGLREKYHLGFKENTFSFGKLGNGFLINSGLNSESIYLVTTSRPQSIFNAHEISENNGYFRIVDQPLNHLVFIHSDLGNHYYLGDYHKGIGYFPLEHDPMMQSRFMSGLGRYQLFMALGATEKPRMVMELTTTLMKQFTSALPLPVLQGESPVPLPFVGRGSGRVFSAPVVPQTIDGFRYLGIDIGRDGQQFPTKLTGLMLLYGQEIPVDQRRLTAFGRDISLISEAEYQALKVPNALTHFPADLADRGLEYSGIYEDGWISERAFVTLAPKPDTRFLVIKGMVPRIDTPDFRNTLAVSIDGREVIKHPLGLGAFDIKLPVEPSSGRHRIDLVFDRYQVLPGEDGRPTGAKIDFLGYANE